MQRDQSLSEEEKAQRIAALRSAAGAARQELVSRSGQLLTESRTIVYNIEQDQHPQPTEIGFFLN